MKCKSLVLAFIVLNLWSGEVKKSLSKNLKFKNLRYIWKWLKTNTIKMRQRNYNKHFTTFWIHNQKVDQFCPRSKRPFSKKYIFCNLFKLRFLLQPQIDWKQIKFKLKTKHSNSMYKTIIVFYTEIQTLFKSDNTLPAKKNEKLNTNFSKFLQNTKMTFNFLDLSNKCVLNTSSFIDVI